MEREQVIEYLATLNYSERQRILDEVRDIDHEKSKSKYEKNRKSYLQQVEKHRKQGEEMKKKVKVGDIIKCRGTNDGRGFREVIEVKDHEVVCRKLSLRASFNTGQKWIVREHYITTHGWEKVAKIYDKDKIPEIRD